jgi:DNA-directed RNA polymerase specialized sigma24 family protein
MLKRSCAPRSASAVPRRRASDRARLPPGSQARIFARIASSIRIVSAAMASATEWKALCDRIGESACPGAHPDWKYLYEWARALAKDVLKRKWGTSAEDAEDVAQECLATRWREILAADNPQALFVTILVRLAIDRHRRAGEGRTDATDPEVLSRMAKTTSNHASALGEHQLELTLIVAWIREHFSTRDGRVFLCAVQGMEAHEIAATHGISKDNVHQIVHRVRAAVTEVFR